jgi:hypothetical protein
VTDGVGGYFIGGNFGAIGGVERRNLAHILADGSLAAWCPDPDAEVDALALGSGTLYVAGGFRAIGGAERHFLAAVDRRSGKATVWRPDPDDVVRSLIVAGQNVVVAGDFSNIAGGAHQRLALFEQDSLIANWNPAVNGRINCLTSHGGTLYIGGQFNVVNGEQRNSAAALDLSNGHLLDWDPRLSRNAPSVLDGGPNVDVIALQDSTVLIGGAFDHMNGVPRNALGAVDLEVGTSTGWNPGVLDVGPVFPARIRTLTVLDQTVCVGGSFAGIGGQTNGGNKGLIFSYAAAIDRRSGLARTWNPNPDGPVQKLVVSDDQHSIVVGGDFHSVWDWQPRAFLAAFDRATGIPTQWDPKPNGFVRSLALHDSVLFVVGSFTEIGGLARAGAAALNIEAEEATEWDPSPDGTVRTVAYENGAVYLGGGFRTVRGQSRRFLTAVDPLVGEPTEWTPAVNDWVFSLVPTDSSVYIAGLFTSVGGQRRIGLAAVDARSAAVTAWDPHCNNFVNSIATHDTVLYAGGYFDSLGNAPRVRAGAVSLVSGSAIGWRADTGGVISSENYVISVTVADDLVYIGGGFTTVNDVARLHLAAVGRVTGALAGWRPDPDGFVWTVEVEGGVAYVGGSFSMAANAPAGCFAAIPVARVGEPIVSVQPMLRLAQIAPNPAVDHAVVRFSLSRPGPVRLAIYDLQGRRVSCTLDITSCMSGAQETILDTRELRSGYYNCRIQSGSDAIVGKLLVVR